MGTTRTDYLQKQVWDLGDTAVGMTSNIVDFSTNITVASDVIQVLKIDAGMTVMEVFVEVLVVEDSTLTFTTGDGSDVDGWVASVNAESLGNTRSLFASDAYALITKTYAAADTIDLALSAHVANTAKIRVTALVCRPKPA